jgi:predicted HD phosphohydrolase
LTRLRPGRTIGGPKFDQEAAMADGEGPTRAQFASMAQSTRPEWAAIMAQARAHARGLPERLLAHMELLRDGDGGFAVDRMEHSLQTATRAYRAGRDEEYVVCALIHDIGDTLGPAQHAEIGAAILKPYVSEENHWIMQHHAIFQGYYFFHHIGRDREMRERFRGHPHFEATAQFCHLYDQNSFEQGYDTMPIDAFTPMLRRVLERPRTSIHKAANGQGAPPPGLI